MSSKQTTSLEGLFVFNSTYGTKEGEEHKKLLFYYPQDADIDVKIRNVGLCEAVIKFTQTFNQTQQCESLHTQKTRQVFLQPENDFWMVMKASIPCIQKVKDGQTLTEYNTDDVQDNVLLGVLKQTYSMFKLFMGTFKNIVVKSSVENLKQKMEYFFSRYVQSLTLAHADIKDVFNGIQFLPLDKKTFLKVHCFCNLLEASFPSIQCSAFIYNDHLVWSGLNQSDMQTLYQYLVLNLLPAHMESEIHEIPSSTSPRLSASFTCQHYGRFVTGPSNLNEVLTHIKVPKVYVTIDGVPQVCHLIVYRAHSASVCFLIDEPFQLTLEFFKKLDSFLGPQMTNLASYIADVYSKKVISTSTDPSFKFIYFNHMNLAQKSTIHLDQKSSCINVPPDAMKLVADVNAHLSRLDETGEILSKTQNECWVIGKRSDEREFYVVINQRNMNLIQINDELKKLCLTHFSKIFYLD